jgi:hypothetical protein
MNSSEISKFVDGPTESTSAHPPDICKLPNAVEPLNIRSIAVTGIFFLLVLYTLKLASPFFIPVVLAVLLNFLFASTIRTLQG